MNRLVLSALVLTLGSACSSKSSTDTLQDGAVPDSSTNTGADGGTQNQADGSVQTPTWTTLVDGDWTLGAGEEDYQCVLLTVPEDMYVRAIRPVAPLGTHHTVLTTVPTGQQVGNDRQFSCDGFTVGPHMLYGSGVGTEALEFPEGVAFHLTAGQKILLNLHLFNFGTSPITGHSAIEVQTIAQSEVEQEAEIVLAGIDQGLRVPARQTSTQTGRCTFNHEQTIFAVFPHMHQTGAHMRVVATRSGQADTTVMDTAYSFDDQRYQNIAPGIVMPAGSSLTIDCTYDNPGDQKHFGESSNDEMCYAGVYRFPAANAQVSCTD